MAAPDWQTVVKQTRAATEQRFVDLAPGVRGYTIDLGDDGLYLPYAESTEPGQGNFGRWLDSLPTDRRVVIPSVVNPTVVGMLARRGFRETAEYVAFYDVFADVWERGPL
jgi:hypothetical protein